MATELSVSYEVISVSGGQARERIPNASVYQPSVRVGRRPTRDAIYVLADFEEETHPDLVHDVVETLQEEYLQHPSRSVTSALIGAIKAANERLYQANLQNVLAARAAASISCLVVRGEDVYVGWAGRAPVYIVHEEVLQRVPAEPEPADEVNLVGLNDGIEVRLYHSPLNVGDVVLLATGNLEQMVTPGQLRTALSQASLAGIRAQLIELARGRSLTAVIAQAKEGAPAPAREAPARRAGGPPAMRRELWPWTKKTAPSPGPAAPVPQKGPESPAPRTTRAGTTRTDRPTVAPERPPLIPRISRAEAAPVGARRPAASGRRLPLPPLLALAAGIVVVLILVAVGIFAVSQWQSNQAREAYFANLLTRAEQMRTQAQGMAERTVKVQTLRQARSLVSEALTMKPDDKAAAKLRQDIERDLDQASLVAPLYGWILLTDFKTAGSQATQLWIQNDSVYVLDTGRGILYRYALNQNRDGLVAQTDEAAVLFKTGQAVGDRLVESLQFIFWMPAGGGRQEGILAMDLNAHLFGEVGQGQRTEYDVGDRAQWSRVVAGAGYTGNLYLLDAGNNQIHKYVPSATGYPGPATTYLQTSADLSTGRDIAIDGEVYVLLANGQILRFLTGEEQPFPMTGLDVPLKDPRAIFCTEATQSVYVVDAGEERIVQFSKEGTFQRQFKYNGPEQAGLFADVRDVSVTEGPTLARIYVLGNNKLVAFPLPPLDEVPLQVPAGQ